MLKQPDNADKKNQKYSTKSCSVFLSLHALLSIFTERETEL